MPVAQPKLVLHSAIDGSHQRVWRYLPAQTPQQLSATEIAGAAKGLKRGDLVWLVHSEDILLLSKPIQAKRTADLVRAVPYAVEEELAVLDVEACRFAIHRTAADQPVSVAVADAERLQQGYKQLTEAGLRPARIVPDVLALDWQPQSWTVLLDGERALVRTACLHGYAVDRDNLDWALKQSWSNTAQEARPQTIRVFGGELPELDWDAPLTRVDGDIASAIRPGAQGLPALDFAEQLNVVARFGVKERRYLGLGAALLIGALGLAWNNSWLQGQQLLGYEQRLKSAMESAYRRAVPGAKRVVDARLQIEQHLQKVRGQQSGQDGMLPALADLSAGIAAIEGASVKSINYQKGVFLLKLDARSVQQLDAIKLKLQGAGGYRVSIESIDKREDSVGGTLRIRRGA